MVQYKLTYFDFRGLGEPIRILFKYAGVDFEEVRIPMADWPKIKPTTPTGKVPFIEVDGKVLPESCAILRYLGRQYNLIGADEYEAAVADSTIDTYRDFETTIAPFFMVGEGFREGDVDQLYKDVYLPNRGAGLQRIINIIAKTKSGFIVDSGVTWADFYIAEHITSLLFLDKNLENAFPQIVAYQKKVFNLPQIKDYIATRKQTNV